MNAEEIKNSVANLPPEEAIARLTAIIDSDPKADEAYTLRGQIQWSLNRRGAAMTDYLAAIRLNPQSRAKTLLAGANQILNFFNKDLYNP